MALTRRRLLKWLGIAPAIPVAVSMLSESANAYELADAGVWEFEEFEDLSDVIYNIAPTETPFLNTVAKRKPRGGKRY